MSSRLQGSIIQLRGIDRQYGEDPPINALAGVDLEVSAGEWLTIVGPSGSGKSTMLNILGLLDVPTSGSYLLDGISVAELSDGQRAGLRSSAIGFVFQSFYLIGHRSVVENVMLSDVYRPERGKRRSERALSAIARVGLIDRADFLPTRLSGGERQRAAIARAIMGSPRVLLCDEPTGNLDTKTTVAILDLLNELNRDGLTIVMITHDADVAAQGHRQVRIVDGKLTEQQR